MKILDYHLFKKLMNEGNLDEILKYEHNQQFINRFTREKLEECDRVEKETLGEREKNLYHEWQVKGITT